MDTNDIKAANEAVYNYTLTAVKKATELQTTLFKDWVALNQKLVDMTPAKSIFAAFK